MAPPPFEGSFYSSMDQSWKHMSQMTQADFLQPITMTTHFSDLLTEGPPLPLGPSDALADLCGLPEAFPMHFGDLGLDLGDTTFVNEIPALKNPTSNNNNDDFDAFLSLMAREDVLYPTVQAASMPVPATPSSHEPLKAPAPKPSAPRSDGLGVRKTTETKASRPSPKAAKLPEPEAAAPALALASNPEQRRINSTWRAKLEVIRSELDQVAAQNPAFAGLSAKVPDVPAGWNTDTTRITFESWTSINNAILKFSKVVGRALGTIPIKRRDTYRGTVEDVLFFIERLHKVYDECIVLVA